MEEEKKLNYNVDDNGNLKVYYGNYILFEAQGFGDSDEDAIDDFVFENLEERYPEIYKHIKNSEAEEELKKGIECGGRKLQELDDGTLVITLNREDCLKTATQVWADYTKEGGKQKDFGRWLSNELGKEREKRVIREMGLDGE